MKVALVYDRVNKWGGAERVLLALHEIFPKAPLYTSLYAPNKAKWAKIFPKVIPSFLNKVPFFRNKHEFLGTFMPFAFESFDFKEFDLVISVTSEAAKGILVKPSTKHICYCLTPTRYLWSHYRIYFKGLPLKGVVRPIIDYLRCWDKIAGQRPDVIVAISTEVKRRISKYYNRKSLLVFPPVEIANYQLPITNFRSNSNLKVKNLNNKEYYLVVSRLVPYKKVDLAVQAFNKVGKKLIIVGVGSEEKKLKKLANQNIFFTGFVDEPKLSELYRGAKALIMPQEEDFGIAAVEAQASGCPVIAYKKGGALDTVIEGKTGIFFNRQNVDSLVDAVKKFARMKFKTQDLIENAKRFSKERFKADLLKLIHSL